MLKKATNIIHLIHGLEGENQTVVLRYGEKPWNCYPRLNTEGNKSTGLLPILRDNWLTVPQEPMEYGKCLIT